MNKDSSSKSLGTTLTIIGAVALILSFIPVLIYIKQFSGPLETNSVAWGTFGDYIGGIIGPILSFAAFIAILYTIHLQNRELQNSVRELAISSEALTQQSDSFKLQNFESAYFELIRLLMDVTKSFELPYEVKGFDAFGTIYQSFANEYKERIAVQQEVNDTIMKTNISNILHLRLSGSLNSLYHFYGILESLFVLIHGSKVDEESKYTQILRSVLSIEQVLLLFYFIIWEQDRIKTSKLQFYVTYYQFFEKFDVKLLIYPKLHWTLYNKEAYGKSYDKFYNDVG